MNRIETREAETKATHGEVNGEEKYQENHSTTIQFKYWETEARLRQMVRNEVHDLVDRLLDMLAVREQETFLNWIERAVKLKGGHNART